MKTAEQRREKRWQKWVASRPTVIQKMIKATPPDRLYELKSTGQHVIVVGYSEGGTITVEVRQAFNPHRFTLVPFADFHVFGINPKDLKPLTEH